MKLREMVKKVLSIMVMAGGLAVVANGARADGFIAGALRDLGVINEQQRQELDQFNHDLGNPVDHAGAAVLDAYIPGAGKALEAGWSLQRR